MRNLSKRQTGRAGISLVELIVAVALLSLVSLAAVQLMNMTERTMIGSQTNLNQQLRSESITSYIYKDFARGELGDDIVSRTYRNDSMPEDLRDGTGVTVVSLYGKASRFSGVDPRCPLERTADPATGTFRMPANCMIRGGQTIVQQMNDLISKGIVLTTGLEGGIGRCSISRTITVDAVTNIATVKVDDPDCLRSGTDRTVGVPKGNHVLLPRFVAYDSTDPRIFHTSMIEPPDLVTTGIGLEMPDTERVKGGGIPNRVAFVDVLADNGSQTGTLVLETGEDTAKLFVSSTPATVTSSGSNTRKLQLSGPIADIRTALATLHYVSPQGFFGSDRILGKLGSGHHVKKDVTNLNVIVNCGGVVCPKGPPTGLRFDLGKFDPVTGKVKAVKYITSVSMCGDQMPSRFFGYCRRGYIFNQPSGLPMVDPSPPCVDHRTFAANPASGRLDPNFPFIRKSASFRDFHRPDHLSIYLYEQFEGNESAVVPKGGNALTNNRFSLFFIFDTVDQSGGDVNFTLSNIEPGRNLRDLLDPFTMSDDPADFLPGIIGTDGTLTTNSDWGIAHDGGVVPLRLPDSAYDNSTGFFELKHYAEGDPQLKLGNWSGLQGWNIRATNEDGTGVTWLSIPFDNATSTQKTDFQLVISGSQRCEG